MSRQREQCPLLAAGEDAVVTNALKAWQHTMQQDTPYKFRGSESHLLTALLASGLPIILVLKRDTLAIKSQQTLIADGDSMCVAAKIFQHLLRASKRRLGVNHPFDLAQRLQPMFKNIQNGWVKQGLDGSLKPQLAIFGSLQQSVKKESAEPAAEDANTEKEAGASGDPTLAVRTQPAAGHNRMDVRVKCQILPPGMKNGEESDVGTEMFRVSGNGLQSTGTGLKQQVIKDFFVLLAKIVQRVRDGEDDVKVLDRQQFALAPFQPLCPGQILALGTMAIATRVVTDALMGAVAASFHMPAQGRRAATLDGAHQLMLIHRHSMLLAITCSVRPEDVGHFKGSLSHLTRPIVGTAEDSKDPWVPLRSCEAFPPFPLSSSSAQQS